MNQTYLMQADIDLVNMSRWSAAERQRDADRALHCLVYESFGPSQTPKPFSAHVRRADGEPVGRLLAYTPLDSVELKRIAKTRQTLPQAAVLDPKTIRTTPIPNQWQEGSTIGFQIRVWPCHRTRPNRDNQPKGEHDVYLRANGNQTREEAYCQWLTGLIQRQGGAEALPETLRMTKFALRRVQRQTSQKWIIGPDVTIEGACVITDAQKWQEAVTKGIGRHKAFGYGMLLLKPVA